MKQILYILAIMCILTQSHAQTSTQNYIRTRTYLYQTDAEYRDQVTYFDGVGRPVQTVQAAVTPAKKTSPLYRNTMQPEDLPPGGCQPL